MEGNLVDLVKTLNISDIQRPQDIPERKTGVYKQTNTAVDVGLADDYCDCGVDDYCDCS